jgi:hypothetical protein
VCRRPTVPLGWLRCEFDAAYFHLVGIAREDVDHTLEIYAATA